MLDNAKVTEGCIISAPKEEYGLDDIKAAMLERRLLALMERLPISLCALTDVLKHRFLVAAISMKETHPLDVPITIPFRFEHTTIDGQPAILLRTLQFSETSESFRTAVAMLLHAEVKEGAVALPSPIFTFHGLALNETWAGVEMPREKRAHIRQIAQNIVSHIHLVHADPNHTRMALLILSKMHDIPLLLRGDEGLEFAAVAHSGLNIANLNEASGLVTPSSWTGAVAPSLPTIATEPHTNGGHLVMKRTNARFLITKDSLVAWADGAHHVDMQRKHGDEVMQNYCLCSTRQS